jgi:hypothetical protein
MVLMTFDRLAELEDYCQKHGIDIEDEDRTSTSSLHPQSDEELLLLIHHQLLDVLANIRPSVLQPAMNREQCGMYLTFLSTIPSGQKLIDRYFTSIPTISGPKPVIPSRLHAEVIQTTIMHLNENQAQNEYEAVNEFNGLPQGSFPLDAAIYYRSELAAFVEIDGEFHYKQLSISPQLRRKDILKETLYNKRYPEVPFFRIRYDQCAAIGIPRAGHALAQWILSRSKLSKNTK